jgi:hypothetical protein
MKTRHQIEEIIQAPLLTSKMLQEYFTKNQDKFDNVIKIAHLESTIGVILQWIAGQEVTKANLKLIQNYDDWLLHYANSYIELLKMNPPLPQKFIKDFGTILNKAANTALNGHHIEDFINPYNHFATSPIFELKNGKWKQVRDYGNIFNEKFSHLHIERILDT